MALNFLDIRDLLSGFWAFLDGGFSLGLAYWPLVLILINFLRGQPHRKALPLSPPDNDGAKIGPSILEVTPVALITVTNKVQAILRATQRLGYNSFVFFVDKSEEFKNSHVIRG